MMDKQLLDALGEVLESLFVFDVATPYPVWVDALDGRAPLTNKDAERVMRLKGLYEDVMIALEDRG